jgi:hypothetical protein
MELSVMMAPKTSKSQVGADFYCGWGNCHICSIHEKVQVSTLNMNSRNTNEKEPNEKYMHISSKFKGDNPFIFK